MFLSCCPPPHLRKHAILDTLQYAQLLPHFQRVSFSRQVTDSSPGAVGVPTPFFARRPDATDASEGLPRYPTDGLLALFQREKLYYPKGWDDEILLVDEEEPSLLREQAAPETPTVGKGKPASKVKGKGAEQPFGDDSVEFAVERRWQTIKREVGSNRCLVVDAGRKMTLKAPRLFELANDVERRRSLSGEVVGTLDNGMPENETGRASLAQLQSDGPPCRPPPTRTKREYTMIGSSSSFTVCLDFRLDLDLDALNSNDGMIAGGEESSPTSGGMPAEKAVKIVTCGERVEVYAMMRRWASATQTDTLDSAEKSSSARESEEGITTKDSAKYFTADQHSERLSHTEAADAASSTIWYVHAFSVRAGSTFAIASCVQPKASQGRHETEVEPEMSSDDTPQEGRSFVCDLATWHALGLIANNGSDLPALCIDGSMLSLQPQDTGAVASDGEESFLASDGVVIGGEGGQYAMLAVKNLAVYNRALQNEHLGVMTGVFRTWRKEQEAAAAEDEQEDERWSEEARHATEEDREPGEGCMLHVVTHAARVIMVCRPRGARVFHKIFSK